MSKLFTVLVMLFFHVLDDFRLQGILADMKQRSWWKEQEKKEKEKQEQEKKEAQDNKDTQKKQNSELYRHDYIIALFIHSFSWTFMIMLPLAYHQGFSPNGLFLAVFAANLVIHAVVDHLKANAKKINLITDQLIHVAQIVLSAYIVLWLAA
ncbi:MAG: DUF3307 domain-containing protein [Ruminococcaceae bacterium]|nr:DUF3307 domain-containing protein [Oscillospiraceae bacterium]